MTIEHSPGLEVRMPMRPQLPSFAVLVVLLLVVYVIPWLAGWRTGWTTYLGMGTFGGALVLGSALLWRESRRGWFVRIDHAGVTPRAGPTVSWTDIACVRVNGLRPRWWTPGIDVFTSSVTFLPRPGVELPSFVGLRRGLGGGARRFAARIFGSPMRFCPAYSSATAQQVIDTVRAVSTVPVDDHRDQGAP